MESGSGSGFPSEQFPQDRLKDPAVPVVLDLDRRVDPDRRVERDFRPVGLFRRHGQRLRGLQRFHVELNVEDFLARQTQRLPRLAVLELERQNAHPDQVAAVDALVALRDDRPHAEQARALGGPVTA